MIPIPTFTPGGSIKTTANGWRVTSPETDPDIGLAPITNGGINANCYGLGSDGTWEAYLAGQAVWNARYTLGVNAAGNLTLTDLAIGRTRVL